MPDVISLFPYHTTLRMTVPYNSASGYNRYRVYLWFKNKALNYGRNYVYFSLPAGLDPEIYMALYTIHFDHEPYESIPGHMASRSKVHTVFEQYRSTTSTLS